MHGFAIEISKALVEKTPVDYVICLMDKRLLSISRVKLIRVSIKAWLRYSIKMNISSFFLFDWNFYLCRTCKQNWSGFKLALRQTFKQPLPIPASKPLSQFSLTHSFSQ